MKKFFILIFVSILLLNIVYSVPQLPTGYRGILYDTLGRPVENKEVEVRDIYNVLVGRGTTNEEGLYLISVIWDDPETSGDEGVTAGDIINFYVDSMKLNSVVVGEEGESYVYDLVLIEEERQSDYSFSSSSPIRADTIEKEDKVVDEENKTKTEENIEQENQDLEIKDDVNLSEEESKNENLENEKLTNKFGFVNYLLIAVSLIIIILIMFKIIKKRGEY